MGLQLHILRIQRQVLHLPILKQHLTNTYRTNENHILSPVSEHHGSENEHDDNYIIIRLY